LIRRHDLDWLRVLVILVVFVFHCGRFFDTDGWHVKNPVRHESVLPFYILHQTVILTIGFFVVRWAIPDLAKFVVIAASSFAIIVAIYEFAIRRHNAMRFLFGMKRLVLEGPDAIIQGWTNPVDGWLGQGYCGS
jgi:peptidoglycan/LPS O-acetylase OafA/YrhL